MGGVRGQAKAATFAVNILRDECEISQQFADTPHTHTQIRIPTCTLCWLLAMWGVWAWHLLFAFTVVFIILLNKDKAINYFCLRSARPFRQMSAGVCESLCVCVCLCGVVCGPGECACVCALSNDP